MTSGHGWLQNSSTRFIKICGLAVRTSNIIKLRTCGCRLQKSQSCGLAVADFKNYKVADLRLRIQESWNVVADLRLPTKLLNVQLRTCGCGLIKLKFDCGFADLKKNLRCPKLVFRGGIGPWPSPLGGQDSIISIERYAKLQHCSPPPLCNLGRKSARTTGQMVFT